MPHSENGKSALKCGSSELLFYCMFNKGNAEDSLLLPILEDKVQC